jgi:hypothetical protein
MCVHVRVCERERGRKDEYDANDFVQEDVVVDDEVCVCVYMCVYVCVHVCLCVCV